MNHDLNPGHPIRFYFAERLRDALRNETALPEHQDVEQYLGDLLVRFMHNDAIFSIRNAEGRRVDSLAEMLAEGDVRLRADSFQREREVHRHLGDFLIFWTGLFPEFARHVGGIVDPVAQGRASYHVVSTFDHDPYAQEAELFRLLSEHFEDYRYGLRVVRASFEGFSASGLDDGFAA